MGLSLNARWRRGRGTGPARRAGAGPATRPPRPGQAARSPTWSRDTAEVLDALGAGEYVSIGFSGGGPHTLACAALRPAAASPPPRWPASPPTPRKAWTSWPAWDRRTSRSSASRCAAPTRSPRSSTRRRRHSARSPASRSSRPRRAHLRRRRRVLTGEFAADLAKGLRGAVRDGIAGWRDDDLAFVAGWGFPWTRSPRRVAIWQGDQDKWSRSRTASGSPRISPAPAPTWNRGRPPHDDRHRHRPDPRRPARPRRPPAAGSHRRRHTAQRPVGVTGRLRARAAAPRRYHRIVSPFRHPSRSRPSPPLARPVRTAAEAAPDAALPGAGVPDAFGRLWTPHRLAYIQGGASRPAPATTRTARSASRRR